MRNSSLLLIGPGDGIGGHATYAHDILKNGLDGFQIRLFNTSRKKKILHRDTTGSEVKPIGLLSAFSLVWVTLKHLGSFARIMIGDAPDVVLITGCGILFWEQMWFILFSKLRGCRCVLHYHGPLDLFWNNANPIVKKLIKFFYGKLDKLFVLSIIDQRIANQFLPKNRVIIVANYIHPQEYDLKAGPKRSAKDEKIRFLFLGGSRPVQKGAKDLILAIQELDKIMADKIIFIFCGSDKLKTMIEHDMSSDWRSIVEFKGWISEEEKKISTINATS